MCIPLFCTGRTGCIRRTSPFCLSSVVVASSRHILGRRESTEVVRLSVPSSPECRSGPVFRLQRAPHDRHAIHSRHAFSRNALSSMECGQSEIHIAQPPVGGRLDRFRSRSMVAGISRRGFLIAVFSSAPRNLLFLIRRAESISCLLCFP